MAKKIRFLHISKTGGSTLAIYLKAYNKVHPDHKVTKYSHKVGLAKALESDPDAEVSFFIREPFSRFLSGFYSRQREGRPSHYHAWSKAEKRTFTRFKTANELAEALSSWNPFIRFAARSGMRSIGHVRRTYASVLGSVATLEASRDRIGFILRQDQYDADFARMIRVLGLDPAIELPKDDQLTHKAPSGEDRRLSERARANLANWFAEDFPIYEWCLKRREEILKAHGEV